MPDAVSNAGPDTLESIIRAGSWDDADGHWDIWLTTPAPGIFGTNLNFFIRQPSGVVMPATVEASLQDPITAGDLKTYVNSTVIPAMTQAIKNVVANYHASQLQQMFRMLNDVTVVPGTDPPQVAPLP